MLLYLSCAILTWSFYTKYQNIKHSGALSNLDNNEPKIAEAYMGCNSSAKLNASPGHVRCELKVERTKTWLPAQGKLTFEEARKHAFAGIDADFDAESSGWGEVNDAGSHSDSGGSTSDDDQSGGGTGSDDVVVV